MNNAQNDTFISSDKETINQLIKEEGVGVNDVNKAQLHDLWTYQEEARGLIIELLDSGRTKSAVGSLIGYSGNYVSMILSKATWPKKAEYQVKLVRKLRSAVHNLRADKNKEVQHGII